MKKERLDLVLAAGKKQSEIYKKRFIGKVLTIVPERCIHGVSEGYSENYLRVYVQGDIGKEPTRVCVEGLFQDGVMAKICKK